MECCGARGMSAKDSTKELDKVLSKWARPFPTPWQLWGEGLEKELDEGAPLLSGRHWNKTVQGSPGAPAPLPVRLSSGATTDSIAKNG